MKSKRIYIFGFLFVLGSIQGQVLQLDLSKGNCQLFNGSLYSFGLLSRKPTATFGLYKLNPQLKISDSLIVELGKTNQDSYLQIYSDTLHDYLNVYIQKKEKKAVTVLRFNKQSELVATLENIDIARLNNTSIFSSEVLYFKNNVYTIKTESDTSGKQFYLNKYDLKSETDNFDYEFKWQFPFERKNVQSAHIFFANKRYVLLFVTVSGGIKTGQWILRINSETGKLVRGTKLNDKGESSTYCFGDFFMDDTYKSFHITGQKFTEAQFSQKENTLNISNAPFAGIYHAEIDSLGDLTHKQEFKIPITEIKTGAKKTPGSYILRFSGFRKTAEGGFSFEGDIFKSNGNSPCFLYANTTIFNIVPAEDKLVLEKNSVSPNPQIEEYYQTPDKLDMNGKLCTDSLNPIDKLFYKSVTFRVKQQFKRDADKNPLWILTKSSVKKNSINYMFLSPVKKIYQLSLIEEIPKSFDPLFINLSPASFLISSQPEAGKYQLKLFNW